MTIHSIYRKSLFVVALLSVCFNAYAIIDSDVVVNSIDISGGVNEFDRESIIEDNQSTVLKNAVIRKAGITQKRDGVTEITGNLTDSTVNCIAHYYKLGDVTKRLLVQHGNDLDVYNGTSWAVDTFTDLTVSGECEIFTAGDFAWFVSPNMATRVYNWTDLTVSGGTQTDPPDSKAGIYHKGRVLLWGNTSNPDWFWYSQEGPDISDLLTFDRVSNALKVDSGDNQELVALIDYGLTGIQGLLALKEKSIYYIDTSELSPGDWQIVQMFGNYGCVARRTAVKVANDILFLSREGNQYKVMTLSRTQEDKINLGTVPLSNPVADSLSDISNAYISNACATFYDGYYILAFPSGSSTYNDKMVVYDTQTKSWIEWTGLTPCQFTTFIEGSDEYLFYGNDLTLTNVFRMFDGDDDNGTAINYQEESKQWQMGFPHLGKTWRDIEFEFTGTDDSKEVELYINLDNGEWTRLTDKNGSFLNLKVNSPTLPVDLPFNLVQPGIIKQTYDLSQFGDARGLKWKIIQNETGIASQFERLGVYLRAYVNKHEWEGV